MCLWQLSMLMETMTSSYMWVKMKNYRISEKQVMPSSEENYFPLKKTFFSFYEPPPKTGCLNISHQNNIQLEITSMNWAWIRPPTWGRKNLSSCLIRSWWPKYIWQVNVSASYSFSFYWIYTSSLIYVYSLEECSLSLVNLARKSRPGFSDILYNILTYLKVSSCFFIPPFNGSPEV